MKQVPSLQRQHRKHRSSATTAFAFAEPTRLFAPVADTPVLTLPHERQERPAHVAQFRHSFDRLSIRPPVPDGSASNEVEQSRKRSDMQQTEEQLSSVQRKEAERQPTPKTREPLQNVVQRYDIKAFDSWDEHLQWLLRNHIPLPEGLDINIEVGFLATYIREPDASKAVYLAPGQEGLTPQGEELCDKGEHGAILLSKEYVEQVGSLPSNERVATLRSTIRHELQHVENLATELVPEEPDDVAMALDEAIAHSENILNKQLRGNSSSAPLWDQIDHLAQAEDYLEKAGNAGGRLKERAIDAVRAANQQLRAELCEYGDPDKLMNEYLVQVDFITFDPLDPNSNPLASRSRIMDKILNEALDKKSGRHPPRRAPRLSYNTAKPADVKLSSDLASGVFC